MPSPVFAARIPQELYDAVSKYMEDEEQEKTEVLINALCLYIGYELPNRPSSQGHSFVDQLQSLALEVESIKKTIESLSVNKIVNSAANRPDLPIYENVSESKIATLTGISKPKLKEHREKISRGEKDKDSKFKVKVNQEHLYEVKYCGENQTGKRSTQLWSAKPKTN